MKQCGNTLALIYGNHNVLVSPFCIISLLGGIALAKIVHQRMRDGDSVLSTEVDVKNQDGGTHDTIMSQIPFPSLVGI